MQVTACNKLKRAFEWGYQGSCWWGIGWGYFARVGVHRRPGLIRAEFEKADLRWG